MSLEDSQIVSVDAYRRKKSVVNAAGFGVYVSGYGIEPVKMMDMLQYPMVGIQIDKQVLQKASDQERILIFIKNSIRMFHEMDLLLEIEGVADVFTKELAVDLKCDYLQGQFFSGPVDEEGFYRYSRGFNLR